MFASLPGCATALGRTTWVDDARDGIASPSRPIEIDTPAGPRFQPAWDPRLDRGRNAEREAEGARISAQELELAILRFTSRRRALMSEEARHSPGSAEAGGDGAWPRTMQSAWDAVLAQLEAGFAQPKGEVPRRLLIQARVSLEVELETTQGRYGHAPPAVTDRVGRIFGAIALHMRSSAPRADERPRWDREIALSWPVTPLIVTSPFGYRRDPILGRESVRFHAGVDLGGSEGDLVQAAGPGRVVSAGWLGGHGRTVIVQHTGGYQTLYSHMRLILVAAGAEVDVRSALGYMGSSGRATGPHLHFEVRHGGVPIDPLEIVDLAVSHGEKRAQGWDQPGAHAAR